MHTETSRCLSAPGGSGCRRLMWITPDRIYYSGLLGAPSSRTMGAFMMYVASAGQIHVRLGGSDWVTGEVAVIPPYVPHQVVSDVRHIHVVKVEAEAVEACHLPMMLRQRGIVEATEFANRVRAAFQSLCAAGAGAPLEALDFDGMFFGGRLDGSNIDKRIQIVLDRIKADPSGAASAEDCAEAIHLSVSRFLHLFKQEVGVPFRSFRTWKRARSLLHHVNRDSNLAHVAQDTGYPDSTHFSHSIRNIYGLKPKDIFAGSRRLAILGQHPPRAQVFQN